LNLTTSQTTLKPVTDRPTWRQAVAAIDRGSSADAYEHQQLEFKQPASSTKETLALLADASVCFANADGGVIVLGVSDHAGGAGAFVGVPPALSLETVRRGIYDRTEPPITVLAEMAREHDADLMVLTVAAAFTPCSTTAGTATRRLDKECRPFTPSQQREWLAARGMVDWSAETTDVAVGDADPTEMVALRRLLGRAGKSELGRLNDERLLEALGVVESGRLVRAGVLLVGTEAAIRAAVPTHGHIYQYRDTPGQESLFRQRSTSALLSTIEYLINTIAVRSRLWPLNLAGGTQVVLEDLPTAAVRELIVNAFIHRSYETNGSVDIDQSSDGLSVVSPGGLVSGVTPENILTHPSTPRNRRLAEAVAHIALAERTGQGVDRAYRTLLRMGKDPVQFDDRGTSVRAFVSGSRGSEAFVRFVHSSLPEPFGEDVDVLLLLRLLCQRQTVRPRDISVVTQRSAPETSRLLDRLFAADPPLVSQTKRGGVRLAPWTTSELGRAISYRTSGAGEFDAVVIGHLNEYGTISNRALQRLFNLNVYAARDLLRDLQKRGVVVKLGGATSGPGVTYGPGDNAKRR
jgi:ATP-dependent DNA helicase RecG